jgi:DNA end-binding protein Ku
MPTSRERAAPQPQNLVNLMDALRRIAEEEAATTPRKKARKRPEGQSEMLLSIPGRKVKEAAAKPAERSGSRQKKAR